MRILLFLLLCYFLVLFFLKIVRRGLASFFQKNQQAQQESHFENQSRSSPNVIDEMKRCEYCGTYSPKQQAYFKKNLYFCNVECHEQFIKNH